MDFAETINILSEFYEFTGWQIDGFVSEPDLTGFRELETHNELLPIKYSNVKGDAEGFGGTELYKTSYSNGDGGRLFLKIEVYG